MYFKKKSCVKALSLCAFLFHLSVFSAPVSTTRVPNDPTSQRDLTSDEINQVKQLIFNQPVKPYSVNLYGLLQGNVNFIDTTRNNIPDFTVTHARLGVFAVEKHWSGKLEVEFNGNQPPANLTDSEATPKPVYLAQSASNTAGVRQAQINFDFFRYVVQNNAGKNKTLNSKGADALSDEPAIVLEEGSTGSSKSKKLAKNKAKRNQPASASALSDKLKKDTSFVSRLALGGIRVGGASAVSTDATYTPSGFARQDGIFFLENAAFGDRLLGSLGFGVFNNLFATTVGAAGAFQGWGSRASTSPNFLGILGKSSPTRSKAYVLNTNWTYRFTEARSLNAIGYYGVQYKAAVNVNSDGFATTVRNAQHAEASLVYNDTKIFGSSSLVSGNGVSFWYELEHGGDQQLTSAASDPEIAFVTVHNRLLDGYTSALYGLGFGGDTSHFLTNLMFESDRLLYAGSATFVDALFKNPAFSKNYVATQFAGQVGYGYRSLEMLLVGAFTFSSIPSFANFRVDNPASVAPPKKRDQFQVYVTAALYF